MLEVGFETVTKIDREPVWQTWPTETNTDRKTIKSLIKQQLNPSQEQTCLFGAKCKLESIVYQLILMSPKNISLLLYHCCNFLRSLI